MNTMHVKTWLLCAAAGLALAACGGGGGGGGGAAQDESTPPASASANSQGFLAYIAGLANRMWEDAEPRDLGNFTPPSDNTDAQEPVALAGDA